MELNECVDFTIGHKLDVLDKDAINFSGTFYDCIFKRMRFSGSFESARSESSSGYRIDAKKDPQIFFLRNVVDAGQLQAGSKRACNSDNFQAASASKVPRTQEVLGTLEAVYLWHPLAFPDCSFTRGSSEI